VANLFQWIGPAMVLIGLNDVRVLLEMDFQASAALSVYPRMMIDGPVTIMVAIATMRPSFFTSRVGFNISLTGLHILIVLALTMSAGHAEFERWGESIKVMRLALAFAFANVPVTFFIECLYVIFVSLAWSRHYDYDLSPAIPDHAKTFWAILVDQETIFMMTVCGVAFLCQRALIKDARSALEIKDRGQGEATATSLLDMLCDVVVTINSKGLVCGSAPQLSAVLFLAQGSLEGKKTS